jgi:phosphotransferase system IIA component
MGRLLYFLLYLAPSSVKIIIFTFTGHAITFEADESIRR